MPPESARIRGIRSEAERRDRGLSPAALNVRDALEKIAREHDGVTEPELVLLLARSYIRPRLKRGER